MRYILDPQDLIASVDADWEPFASHNGAPELRADAVIGQTLWRYVAGPETRLLLEQVMRHVRDGQPLSYSLRCDSPEARRFLRLDLRPLAGGSVEANSTTLFEEPRPPVVGLFHRQAPGASKDFLTACSWCRRIRLGPLHWVEIEIALDSLEIFHRERTPAITHGICESCRRTIESDLGLARA